MWTSKQSPASEIDEQVPVCEEIRAENGSRKNLCFVLRPVKDKFRETVPKVGMEDPLAALKEEVLGE